MHYGIPYQGSKAIIAQSIIRFLPKGRRLVDLFGGGGAISHCAVLSKKWDTVYYNELNPLLVDLLKRAINGDFNYSKFRPEFITREKFNELKNKDGYVRYIWSFGNAGKAYLFGDNVEKNKQIVHDLIVFDKKSNELERMFKGVNFAVNAKDIHSRRLQYSMFIRKCVNHKRCHIELERLEQLKQLERLQQLEINCGDYKKVKLLDGDVVYCDPPYENTANYGGESFNHKEFYEFCYNCDKPLFFSSYEISDKRFKLVFAKQKFALMNNRTENKKIKNEYLYANKKGEELLKCLKK